MKSASVALIKKNSEVPSYILTSGELHVAQLGNFTLQWNKKKEIRLLFIK